MGICESYIYLRKSMLLYITSAKTYQQLMGMPCNVTCHQELKQESFLQEGGSIGSIYPENESEFYAEICVENSDIGKVEEGQKAKFEIAAFPSSEYGYFSGMVSNISKDITVDENTGRTYFIVKVKCDKMTLQDKDGNNVSLKNGMACTGKIIICEKTVMTYLLQKINIID